MKVLKLTKEQRNSCYLLMLAESTRPSFVRTRTGFCAMIRKLFCINNEEYHNSIISLFSELIQKEPLYSIRGFGCFWFPTNRLGWKERRKLLKQCIEETL